MDNHTTTDPLVAFLYQLMRDHLVPGQVERIMQDSVRDCRHDMWQLSNGYLAAHAEDVAKRLQPKPTAQGTTVLHVPVQINLDNVRDPKVAEFIQAVTAPGAMIQCPRCRHEIAMADLCVDAPPRLFRDLVTGAAGIACVGCGAEIQIRAWEQRVALVDDPDSTPVGSWG